MSGIKEEMIRERFRTAKQTPFCMRNRDVSKQNWEIDPSKIVDNNGTITAIINDKLYNNNLVLTLNFLECGNCAHFTIKPQDKESFNRFDCSTEEAIVNQTILASRRKYTIEKSETKLVIKTEHVEYEITYKPFKLIIKDEKGESISVNYDEQGVFETNRDKTKYPEMFQPTELNGFVDPIKNGPTAVALSFKFSGESERLSGLPSHTLPLSLTNTKHRDPIRFYNTDMCHFGLDETMAMYGAIPFVIGHSLTRKQGLFWANASETWVDITNNKDNCETRFISEGGYIDCYLFNETTNKAIVQDFANLTGKPIFVPRFTLAFHQCKWGYENQEIFEQATHGLDEYKVPHDVMWCDIDYTEGKKYFKFNDETYPHPEKILNDFAKIGRKLVVIVDPHTKVQDGFALYEELRDKNLAIKGPDGKTDYQGECWPGLSIWPDYLNPETRKWWASKYSFDYFKESNENVYIWNDMNEISVFDGPEATSPRDLIHYGNVEEREVHNIYGLLMTEATTEGLRARSKDKTMRSFVLTRSFFAGSQKYTTCWGGDNTSTYEYMKASLQMVFSFGLCGMGFTGSDVGGFFNDVDDTLLSRWHQVGAWIYPFFRNHAVLDVPQREISIMKDQKRKELAREAVFERYTILPYWYTELHNYCETGIPIVRPLFLEYDDVPEYQDIDDIALLGSSLLVIPFFDEEEKDRTFVLPKEDKWYNYRTYEKNTSNIAKYNEGRTLVLIKAGKIITKYSSSKPILQTSELIRKNPLELIVALDEKQESVGEYYDDDGLSEDFKKGEFIEMKYQFENNKLTASLLSKQNEFQEKGMNGAVIDTISILGYNHKPTAVKDSNGKNISYEYSEQNQVIKINTSIPVNEEFTLFIE